MGYLVIGAMGAFLFTFFMISPKTAVELFFLPCLIFIVFYAVLRLKRSMTKVNSLQNDTSPDPVHAHPVILPLAAAAGIVATQGSNAGEGDQAGENSGGTGEGIHDAGGGGVDAGGGGFDSGGGGGCDSGGGGGGGGDC